jgi:hypothetical protein
MKQSSCQHQNTKRALRKRGTLNPHPEKVAGPLFSTSAFFDARDLVQVKYEMVRRVQADRQPVRHFRRENLLSCSGSVGSVS